MNNDIVKGFDEGKDESLRIRLEKVERVPGCLALHLSGYIDAYNQHYFQQKATMAVEAGFTRIDPRHARGQLHRQHGGRRPRLPHEDPARERPATWCSRRCSPRCTRCSSCWDSPGSSPSATGSRSPLRLSRRRPRSPFPKVFACPICEVKLRASRAGRFRCSQCRTILALAETGAVALG